MSDVDVTSEEVDLVKRRVRHGIFAGLACYICWGLFPAYWKLLGDVNSLEIIAQRIIWCFVFTAIVCAIIRADFLRLFKQGRAMKFLIPASILITCNWSIYIIAVQTGNVIEASIGYYINPLVSILLGLVVFGEKLSPLQWVAVAFCCIGVVFFTFNYGRFPWIAVLLAVSFGIYGALKKKGGYPAVEAIAVESAVMVPVAIIVAVIVAFVTGSHAFLGDPVSLDGWATTLLLIGGGAVTAIPLILFATAANSIPLTLVGFLQYLSPTIALLLGVFAFGEAFTLAHAVCLGFIWFGLLLVSVDSLILSRKTAKGRMTPLEAEENKEITN